MTHPEPFGDQRDPRLDAALRELLDGQAHEAFVARLMGQVMPRVSAWDELARWARPGIAAAIMALALMGIWGALQLERAAAPSDVVEMAGLEPLDSEGLVGVALGVTR
ncbi:MAG: hypothetical protein OEV95_12620 [Gemmatimonadota bacterium]|jgi:hypothetical protein|nr:hypothetical protein [Gemmatimonadota bacterium]